MPGKANPSCKIEAFTLVELLSVLTVVLTLGSLLWTAMLRGKQRAFQVVCLNHLKQWGLATQLYTLEHEDWLPRDGAPNGTSRENGWYIDLPRALGIPDYHQMPWRTNGTHPPRTSIWICPSNRKRSNGINLFHYCLNAYVNGRGAGSQVKHHSIPLPGSTIWMFDNGGRAAVAGQNNVHTNVHNQGAQFVFLDGHAAKFNHTNYWDFVRNRGRLGNPSLQWKPRNR